MCMITNLSDIGKGSILLITIDVQASSCQIWKWDQEVAMIVTNVWQWKVWWQNAGEMKQVVTKYISLLCNDGDETYHITKVLMIVTKWDSEVVTKINIPQQRNNNINGHYLVTRKSSWQVGWWRVLTSCPSKVWPPNHCHWITKSFLNIMAEN
jgi:hypothetical protein